MLEDPVTKAALIVIATVFFGVIIAISVLYLLIRADEHGQPKPPHKMQMLLAAVIGIAVPFLILAYALLFSPSARMTPQKLHQMEMQKTR